MRRGIQRMAQSAIGRRGIARGFSPSVCLVSCFCRIVFLPVGGCCQRYRETLRGRPANRRAFHSGAGTNGYNCFPSAETVAGQIGCSPKTVRNWRAHLIHIGWFKVVTRTGGNSQRSLVLDIAIPGVGIEQAITIETTANDAAADTGRRHAGY